MLLLLAYLLLSQVSSALVSTGAYEVTLNGQLIFSKLAEGGAPSPEALVAACLQQGLVPDPAVAARLGLRL
jgi:hypothetical protein